MQFQQFEGAGSIVTSAWAQLDALRFLDLSLNTFVGPVPPSFCNLTDLRVLSLSGQNSGNLDGFTSLPSCLDQLTQLLDLFVSSNALSGALPNLSTMTHLQVLDCSANALSGPLDSGIDSLTELVLLFANSNLFSSVPLSMSAMSALTMVNLASNRLTEITDQFEGCAKLTTLDISDNQVAGPLPTLSGCAQLNTLNLHYNSFNSTIPFAWQSNLPKLVTLHAQHNRIISPVAGIGSLTLLHDIDLRSDNETSDSDSTNAP